MFVDGIIGVISKYSEYNKWKRGRKSKFSEEIQNSRYVCDFSNILMENT